MCGSLPAACSSSDPGLLRMVSVEKILFSVDYPLGDNTEGRKFIDGVRGSDLLTPDELEMVSYRNAEKLLRIESATCSLVENLSTILRCGERKLLGK